MEKLIWIMVFVSLCHNIEFLLTEWASVGDSYHFVCSNSSNDLEYVFWATSKDKTAATCNELCIPQCTKNCVTVNSVRYAANLSLFLTTFVSIFTIKDITPFHNELTITCTAGYQNPPQRKYVYDYTLYVYARPETPSCGLVELNNEVNLRLNCTTEKVYPQALCLFLHLCNNTPIFDMETAAIIYSHPRNNSNGLYKTICTYEIPAATVGQGFHKFQVLMYPNITSNIDVNLNASSNFTDSINLYYPNAILGKDCPIQDFIKEYDSARCNCSSNVKSFLPTQVIWSQNGSKIYSDYTLEFQAIRNSSFQCKIFNKLNWTATANFRPNVSYPPDEIQVNIHQEDFDLCNDTRVAISGNCYVSESNPESSVYVNINNSLTDITSLTNNREYTFYKTVTSTGIVNISCLAKSTQFLSKASRETRTVTIRGPPDRPIILKNNVEFKDLQTHIYWLEVTKLDTLTCKAKGGYPPSKNISFVCGSVEAFETNKDQVTISLYNSTMMNGTCECVVWHASKCLNNTSLIQFKILDLDNTPVAAQGVDIVYIGVGVAVFCVLITIVLLLNIFFRRYDEFKKTSSGETEKIVNNDHLYFIEQDIKKVDISLYPEYTNLSTTMLSAIEAPKNLNKIKFN